MTSFSDFEQLSAYLDGELAPQEQATLEARLASDPALQQDLLSLQATLRLLNDLPTLKAPRSYALPLPRQPRRLWRAVAALLVAVISLTSLWTILRPASEEDTSAKAVIVESSPSLAMTAVAFADTLTVPNTATAPPTQETQRTSPEAGLVAESESVADAVLPPASALPAAPEVGIAGEGGSLPPIATVSNLAAPALSAESLLIRLEQIQRLVLRLADLLLEKLKP